MVLRSRIPAPLIASVSCALATSLCVMPWSASADGFALDRYDPNPAGDLFFSTDFPNYSRLFAAAVTGDYARAPLVAYSNGQPVHDAIDNMLVVHVGATVSFLDRIALNFSLPVSLLQTGDARTPAFGNIGAYNSPVAGDIRVGGRVRLAGQADTDPISVHIGGHLYLGFISYNDANHNVTDEALRGRVYVTLAGHPGPVRWSLNAGYYARPRTELRTPGGTTVIDSEFYANAALGLATPDGRLTIGPEAMVGGGFGQFNAELLLGVHYLLADTLLISVGAGPGLTQSGPGTPQVRGLLRLAYAPTQRAAPALPPPPSDNDADGVPDSDDRCPSQPAGRFPDRARRGCPLFDTDADTVFDNDDQCPDEPQGAHPDPARHGCALRDGDGDGVFDNDDQCVTTPAGATPDPERQGCPDGDDDNDGVFNHADACRTVHMGQHPDPARPGCPLPDRDNDSIPDPTDHCPDQPGAPHPDPNRNGCPGLVRIEAGQVRILTPVFFTTNRDHILPRSYPVLTAVADALRASPEIRRISIEGHTDDVGNDAANLTLSERRANSVVVWLVAHGVEPSRLESHGFGETHPLVPGTSRGARAQNRRVEFRIVDPAQPTTASPVLGATTAPGSMVPATPVTPPPADAPRSAPSGRHRRRSAPAPHSAPAARPHRHH